MSRLPRVTAPRIRRGRRVTDPVNRPVDPGIQAVRGRLAGVSVSASMGAGAWVGFALGLVLGAIIGAALSWFAGALLDWQRDLAFTFGVARRLLPFGDQLALLRGLEANWWLVVPITGLAVGLAAAMVGAVLGGILAAAYNRSPRHALVVVELPAELPHELPGDAPSDLGPTALAVHPPEAATVRGTLPGHGVDREE